MSSKIYQLTGETAAYVRQAGFDPIQQEQMVLHDPERAYASVAEALTLDTTDFHVEAIDLQSNRVACEAGIALVRSFYGFLDQEYTMKAFTTEVWILAISTEPLWRDGMSQWGIHQKHRVWWDYKEHTVRPLYLAFRVGGKLDSIGRVTRIEHDLSIIDAIPEMKNIKEEWPKRPCTVWHFDDLVKLPTPIRTGAGMYNRRVRCDFDLLLTCKTVQVIEQAMKERREQLSP